MCVCSFVCRLLGRAAKSAVCVRCAALPVWSQNASFLCVHCHCVSLSWLYQTSSNLLPRWMSDLLFYQLTLCLWRTWEYYLAKDYCAGRTHTGLKQPKPSVTDVKFTEAWTSRNSPGSYLWNISSETRIMSQTCIVSWSLVWRKSSPGNHQESFLKEFPLRHGSYESD